MTIYYVDSRADGDDDGSDWNNAFPTLQGAEAVAVFGDQIWVKKGVYYSDSTTGFDFANGVSVYGGFEKELSGTGGTVAGRDSSQRSTINGADTYKGFKVTESNITIDGFDVINCYDSNRGAGLEIWGYGSSCYGPELLTDGDMEAVGVGDWTTGGDGDGDAGKETADPPGPAGGSQYLGITHTTGSYAYARQSILTISNTYLVTGYTLAYSGFGSPSIRDGASTVIFQGDQLSSWESFSEEFTATTTYLYLREDDTEFAGANFDEISVKEIIDHYINNITINNCRFNYNNSVNYGGGIFVDYIHSDVEITNCYIGMNSCDTYDGGGLYLQHTHAAELLLIENCTIDTNEAGRDGGGAYINAGAEMKNCIVKNNIVATDGGGVVVDGVKNVQMTNCVVADNQDDGVRMESIGTLTITNCTVPNNAQVGIVEAAGTVNVVNSIVWGNTTQLDSVTSTTYSDVEGGTAGTGNVDDDPLFVGEGIHEYALSALSDAVDAANAGATYYESTDLRGASRYDSTQADTGAGTPTYADMGAYEFQGSPLHTMPMSLYYLNLDAEAGTSYYYMYVVLRLPEMPRQFGGSNNISHSANAVKHEIQSEIESDDADSSLEEVVMIGDHVAAYRTVTGSGLTPPTRSANYQTDFRKSGDSTTAVEPQHPVPDVFNMPAVDGNYWYCIAELRWAPDYDAGSHISIYNVDFEQIHEDAYSFDDLDPSMFPGATFFGPDIPLNSAQMRQLADVLLKMIYEGKNAFSVPVFGQWSVPVV